MNISFSPQQRIYSTNFSYHSNANSPENVFDDRENSKKHDVTNKSNIFKNNANIRLGKKFKKNSLLETLMKQKENLMDNKKSIMERSLEKGEDPKAIKEKIENIDKQIEAIDKQVHELQLEEQHKAIGTKDKNKKDKNSKQELNKNYPNGIKIDPSMNNILNLSTDLKKAEALSSQKNLMSSKARVLDFEIKTDEKRGINPVRKKNHLAKMKDNIEKITQKLGNHLKDVNTKIINNTQSNSSNDMVDKNKQSSDATISKKSKDVDRMVIRQQNTAQNIKNYKDNLKDTVKNSGEIINIIA
ncbi:hypothetical protein ACER0A_005095 [Haloimpatiens sp. FM7315]|uniref:hypothetical protein n=1 Tax=Haloimpatiens sp. FM7315 TaxID=3298609 RepID=UPI0035A2F904